MGLVNTEQQLAFYGEYHANRVNQWIHITCVPIILWTAMVFVGRLEVMDIPAPWVVAAVYGVFYVLMDPVVGGLYCGILVAMAKTSTQFAKEQDDAMTIAVGVHVVAWILQFIGHGVFEKRAPALLDSFLQSLMLAPFFVFIEVLFMFGFRKDVHNRVQDIVGKRILEFRKSQAAKAN
eukprot:TRINITY_DN20422_c0_g1_i1.p1 TRINITY_DN20422_c0_g1~~TRINITY_DN20422_c0_g1_i1.p1  ORF type:complete len:197 (+),score=30.08 TRINITY_DN20422_c0_g1_i1:59-592(+)